MAVGTGPAGAAAAGPKFAKFANAVRYIQRLIVPLREGTTPLHTINGLLQLRGRY